jgi:hypothetical protein
VAPQPGRPCAGRRRSFYEQLGDELLAHAERIFWLEQPEDPKSDPDANGHRQTRREFAEWYERKFKKPHPSLDIPPLPDALAYVWQWYGDLARRRSNSGFGANPIGWVDLDAWARRTQRDPTRYETDLLFAIDDIQRIVSDGRSLSDHDSDHGN